MRNFIREVPSSAVELHYSPPCGRTPPQSTTTGCAAELRTIYLIFPLIGTRNTVVGYLAHTPVLLCVKYLVLYSTAAGVCLRSANELAET